MIEIKIYLILLFCYLFKELFFDYFYMLEKLVKDWGLIMLKDLCWVKIVICWYK